MIEEVFENLVEQFSDPFTFYRELIQNALDAGSNQVDISVEYLPEKEMVLVSVSDAGEGMTLDIIRDQLTRLFSSTKEDDLTKIGKFGIGFVSVFAIGPKLVLVDTGRDGEYWRVAFDGTTDYQCLRLDDPVEGTTIRVYKPLKADEFEAFVTRSRDTIRYWCRYSDNLVSFNGEAINESLAVDSCCVVHHQQSGTEIVAGYTSSALPEFGMYNRGLTLKEGRQEVFPGVTYRIKSRYLEHTLTRDNVLEDQNYEKAMAILKKVVSQDLSDLLFTRMAAAREQGSAGMTTINELMAAARVVLQSWRKILPKRLWNEPLFPCLNGPAQSINSLRRAGFWEGSIYIDEYPNLVVDELAKHQIPVLRASPHSALAEVVEQITGRSVRVASQSLATPVLLPVNHRKGALDRISSKLISLLRFGSVSIQRLRLAHFEYEGSCVRHLPCLAQLHAGEPIRLYHRGFFRSLQKYPGLLLLNETHPLVEKALALAETNPVLSSFVLAKAALLQDGLPGALEAKIFSRCLGMR